MNDSPDRGLFYRQIVKFEGNKGNTIVLDNFTALYVIHLYKSWRVKMTSAFNTGRCVFEVEKQATNLNEHTLL